ARARGDPLARHPGGGGTPGRFAPRGAAPEARGGEAAAGRLARQRRDRHLILPAARPGARRALGALSRSRLGGGLHRPAPSLPERTMSYQPREFWQERLSQHFDLRGSGETGLSIEYNRACYALRAEVLTQVLRDNGFDPRGREVLDVGCGTGF